MGLSTVVTGRTGACRPRKAAQDGDELPLRLMRDGSQAFWPFVHALVAEGRVYYAHAGTASSPITAQTAFDVTLPSLSVEVPEGIIAVPLFFEVQMKATAAVTEAHLMISPLTARATSAAAFTSVTPINARIGNPRPPACLAAHTFTVTGGNPSAGAAWLTSRGNQGDLDALAIDPNYRWSAASAGYIAMVEDQGSINGYVFNSTGSCWITIAWAELDKEDFRFI